MTPEEANIIIAEFMGYRRICKRIHNDRCCDIKWTKGRKRFSKSDIFLSLDALVPVWEKRKINIDHLQVEVNSDVHKSLNQEAFCVMKDVVEYAKYKDIRQYMAHGETAQEAACIATAKAIKELSEG